MSDKPNQIKKLNAIAIDLDLSDELRIKAIQLIGKIGTHEALLALLELVGNEKLIREERDLAIQQAREIIMSGQ